MAAVFQVYYFSRSGHSRRLARQLRDALDGKLTEIVTARYKLPLLGWFRAARDSLKHMAPPLQTSIEMPTSEDTVILVGPVWAGQPAAPLNAALDAVAKSGAKVAVALTCADKKSPTGALDVMAERLGKNLAAGMVMSNAHEGTAAEKERIDGFVADLQASKAQDA